MTKNNQTIWFIDSKEKKKINSWQQSSNLVKETGNFSRVRPSFTLGQAEVSFKAVTENGWNINITWIRQLHLAVFYQYILETWADDRTKIKK